ncbi:Gfo/Idh/MocA family protein [Paenibacillus senegalensis]|uniref:Gfo/Idh/MocA family protein n=1 Tax=Paenibacillus senegalensis TaxID=1465766 RepID=UPI0002895673|nr:Gfo/Idh/MocA family oxidoreductase [Paenibacillus senegalensis]
MNKVRVAIIGLGSWGECHLQAFQALPYVEVTALCDLRPERVQQLADRYQIAGRYEDYAEVCGLDTVDLVSIATFEKEHLQPALLALNNGKHVLVEKPVTTLASEAKQLAAAAHSAKRHLVPGHLLRFDPKYAEIYEGIQNGTIGPIKSIFLRRARAQSLFATYKRTHTVYELMIHDIDLALWYANSRVRKVRAHGIHMSDPGCPEILWVQLEFANGALAVLESHWRTPDAAGIAIADSAEVIGEHGVAHMDTREAGVQIWNTDGRQTPDLAVHREIQGIRFGALREQMNYICQSIALNQPMDYVSFDDAIHGIEIADAIVHSARSQAEILL